MSHRYQRVETRDQSDHISSSPSAPTPTSGVPSSPPPSFHSRVSSPTAAATREGITSSERQPLYIHDPLHSEPPERSELNDAFGTDDSDNEDEVDDRQRLMRGNAEETNDTTDTFATGPGATNGSVDTGRTPTAAVVTRPTTTRVYGSGLANDGVFANLSAKPTRGEKAEDLPPTYEQAAADATPPYWETTILAPGMSSDEVYVDGLPVGSIFSFIWNAMISTSFQLVGFLLTYLLHTTHAAKNGSRAGLGLTLVQYGFYMKGSSDNSGQNDNTDYVGPPPDPNAHDFNPGKVNGGGTGGSAAPAISTTEWIAFILMIVGWFILIRAFSDYLRARRHEQLVLQSPDRGLGVAVIAEGETAETVV